MPIFRFALWPALHLNYRPGLICGIYLFIICIFFQIINDALHNECNERNNCTPLKPIRLKSFCHVYKTEVVGLKRFSLICETRFYVCFSNPSNRQKNKQKHEANISNGREIVITLICPIYFC